MGQTATMRDPYIVAVARYSNGIADTIYVRILLGEKRCFVAHDPLAAIMQEMRVDMEVQHVRGERGRASQNICITLDDRALGAMGRDQVDPEPCSPS